ncbi:hypothetical protein BC629DRAFT_1547090 [Irpex lacteus]|nr:hypothetical protein BC629DRAFT_1547090 [Irpex lacteus]
MILLRVIGRQTSCTAGGTWPLPRTHVLGWDYLSLFSQESFLYLHLAATSFDPGSLPLPLLCKHTLVHRFEIDQSKPSLPRSHILTDFSGMVGAHMRLHRTNRSGLLTERSHQNAEGLPPWEDYSWCSILLVSRLWYEVAIQTTSLWTTLNLTLKTPDCFFERTYMLPLTLHWAVNDSEHRALHQFSSHFFRCGSLSLTSMPDDNGQLAFDGLTSLPLLEILVLIPTQNPLADLFISGKFPKLHTLWYSPRDFQMTYAMFASTLRNLYIDASRSHSKPTLAEIIHGLQQMPLLEFLTMANIVSDTEDARSHTSVAATLENLEMLCIAGPLWTFSPILNALSIPPTVSIEICSRLRADEGLDEPGIVSSLTELAQAICDITHPAGEIVSPWEYMQAQYYREENGGTSYDTDIVARLYCTRADVALGHAHQKTDLKYYERVWRQIDDSGLRQIDFGGVDISIYWGCPELSPEWDWTIAPQAWLQSLIDSLPLKEVSTVALELSEDMIYLTSEISVLTDEGDAYQGLSYLLEQAPDGRRLSAYPHFRKLTALLLDCRHTVGANELVRLRCSLRGLRISHTLTLQKIRIVGTIDQDALIAFKDLKDAFPEIDIAMLSIDYSEIDVEAM